MISAARVSSYEYTEDLDSMFGLAEYYKRLTPAMIQSAAKTYLNNANRLEVPLFPEKK